ncbi:MAG: efflux RND transporter permease subunit [Candidatus Krumholzibacteria bacterium]|nr:efflux RND transporter permease subunit [Candidatus Krumholzibacteria bacterium]MDH4336574.1 efflux RND transporter permease subunit [Candidatus Krumholzibacteria bacterium]MDH5271021.1 efflux RND transporter permease subunit [Candidatus Krumholzibacteria bacterium]
MRSLIAMAVRRRVTVVMAAFAVAAFGMVGYERLPIELFPDISYPSITIQTDFPDTAPPEVEYLITRPVEEAVGVLRGLKSIHSVSRPGASEVTLEFDWDSDMDMLSMEVREKLDRIILPDEAESPIVLRYDPSLDPIMRIALSGDGGLNDMRNLADRKIKLDLETLKGVAAAQVKGGLEDEIQVDVDQERLAAMGIPLDRVREAVGVSNINLPGGSLRGRDSHFIIRTLNEFDTVEEIGSVIVAERDGAAVRLRDVASVTMGSKEREEITRYNGKECVEIAVFKEGDANTVTVSRLLRQRMDEWKKKLPEGYELSSMFDQSHFIEQSIREVRNSAIIGGILAIIVLFLFLREVRSTVIIALSIPLSVIATFMIMYRLDISLNVMSLGGLTLGVGMLVDNSIVVLESIFRKKKAGLSLARAALEGADEVGAAVAASTATTVAVFLPIVFVEGIAGQLFRDQAMTVSISLLASLALALTLIPMLSALGQPVRKADVEGPPVLTDDSGMDEAGTRLTLGAFSRVYDRIVRAAVGRSRVTLSVAFGLFAVVMFSTRFLGTELIPPLTEGEFFFEVKLPEGSSLNATDRVVQEIERVADQDDRVDHSYARIGSRLIAGGMSVNALGEHFGQVNVALKDKSNDMVEEAVVNEMRDRFAAMPDVEAKFGRPSYFSLKTPIEVILFGEDLELLRDYSLDLSRTLENVPGLVDVRSSLEAGNPELQVIFDRDRVAALGLDLGTLSQTLQGRVQGVVPTRFKEADRQIDVRIRNQESDRTSIADVRNLVLPASDGSSIRLTSVADVRVDEGPAEIHRLQQQRAAVVSANLEGRSLGAAVGDVRTALADNPPPTGITSEIGGQNAEMQVSFASLRFAILLAIFLVYLVMAATFESFIHPFIVLFTIPLALVGAVIGLLVTRTEISVMVLIGAVLLVGIVVNNAIVLIDAINRLRRVGIEKREAVVRAGHIRLRPILMTTLTTVLGLIPMAIAWGEGAELRSPLAITVLFGLAISTLLTLVVIPAAYVAVPSKVTVETQQNAGVS